MFLNFDENGLEAVKDRERQVTDREKTGSDPVWNNLWRGLGKTLERIWTMSPETTWRIGKISDWIRSAPWPDPKHRYTFHSLFLTYSIISPIARYTISVSFYKYTITFTFLIIYIDNNFAVTCNHNFTYRKVRQDN